MLTIISLFDKTEPVQYDKSLNDTISKMIQSRINDEPLLIHKDSNQDFEYPNGVVFVDDEYANYFHIKNTLHLINTNNKVIKKKLISQLFSSVYGELGTESFESTFNNEFLVQPIIKAIFRSAAYRQNQQTNHFVLDLNVFQSLQNVLSQTMSLT